MARNARLHSTDMLVDLKRGVVSRELFVNDEIYEQEGERIFARSWLFVGHESQIPRPGDYFVSCMGEESVILTRDREQKIHVYPYNYQMGLGQEYGTYDSPGVLTDRIAEQNQRGFYQRWAACMEELR